MEFGWIWSLFHVGCWPSVCVCVCQDFLMLECEFWCRNFFAKNMWTSQMKRLWRIWMEWSEKPCTTLVFHIWILPLPALILPILLPKPRYKSAVSVSQNITMLKKCCWMDGLMSFSIRSREPGQYVGQFKLLHGLGWLNLHYTMSTCTMVASSNTRRVVACLNLCQVELKRNHTKTRPLKKEPPWICLESFNSYQLFFFGGEKFHHHRYHRFRYHAEIEIPSSPNGPEFATSPFQDLQGWELARWYWPSCTGANVWNCHNRWHLHTPTFEYIILYIYVIYP